MASSASDQSGFPIWLTIWIGWVAAVLLVPTHVLQRFVVQPMFGSVLERAAAGHDPRHLYFLMDLNLRFWGIVFALLYLVARALTARWRRNEEV
jgi:hypothetical protein